MSSPPPPPPSSSSSDTRDLVIGFVVIIGFIFMAAISVGLCCYLWGRKKRRRDSALASQGHIDDSADVPLRHWQLSPLPIAQPGFASSLSDRKPEKPRGRPSPGISLGLSKCIFTYEELEAATNGFSSANLLGQGGFGYVHKGVLSNGLDVAIKQLKAESKQGEREFQAEVEIISRVHHRNLVLLYGCCISGAERMLVYEFISNNTLEFHLHGNGRPIMSWSSRMRIAVGSARGLAYLHEDCRPKIIHRDIKAANILLDNKFDAKVADFGLAKFTSDAQTHVSTRVMGTFGYLAPEYAASGRLTVRSDVYSFGMVLLELLTGHRPHQMVQDSILVNWARPLLTQALEDGNYDTIADPRLQNNYNPNEMARMIACAAACVRESARSRPRMGQIVRALEGSVPSNELNELGEHSTYCSYGSSDSDSQYSDEMNSESMVSGSQGQTTGEHSLHTGSSNESQQTQRIRTEEIGRTRSGMNGYPSSSPSCGLGLVSEETQAG